MASQERILGAPCRILACALEKGIQHCLKDCDDFPCDLFREGAYPFGEGYLRMQERRRNEIAGHAVGRVRGRVTVPAEYWETLADRDMDEVCGLALVSKMPPKGWIVPFLNRHILVDQQTRCIFLEKGGSREFVDNPLLELLCLVYLINAGPETITGDRVGAQDLKTGHFFKGPHEIDVNPLLSRYGNDPDGFRIAAEALGGASLHMGDLAYRFLPFPKVPVYYVMWFGDREFPANLSVLFDRSIECHLRADAILGLADLVSGFLCSGAGGIT